MGFIDKDGYSLINNEQKIRISLSGRAQITMAEDMAVFKITRPASFINTVFANYRSQARASISNYLRNKELEWEQLFSDAKLNASNQQIAIRQLLLTQERELLEQKSCYLSHEGKSKLYHISKANVEYLLEDCEEAKYYNRPGLYLRCVIEEYCSLPFIERERIYKQDIYDKIETACLKKQVLKIRTDAGQKSGEPGQEQIFYVYPYGIFPDPLHTQSYLVCYSRKADEHNTDKIMASFSMARLNRLTVLEQTFHLNKQEISAIEKQTTKYSAAYLIGKPEQIQVRLTENGKKIYQSRLSSRPEKIESLSTEHIYVFDCSTRQAFNYFFSFGSDAEILSPLHLRNDFIQNYTSALKCYAP